MAYKIVKSNGDIAHDVIEFMVDTVEDIQFLPHHVGMGSKAYVINSGELYIKNGKNEWRLSSHAGGGSSSPDDTYIPISTDSISALFKG